MCWCVPPIFGSNAILPMMSGYGFGTGWPAGVAGAGVDLARRERRRQHDGAADVLLRVLERHAGGHRVAGVRDEAELHRRGPR